MTFPGPTPNIPFLRSMQIARLAIWFAAVLLVCAAISAFAQTPKITAVLSNSETVVGRMVPLEIRVSGARGAEAPEEINAPGLEIHRTGERYESQFSFGMGANSNSSSVVYTYRVLALKPGTFKIPPQTIRIGSNSFATPELVLHVAAASGGLAPPNTTNSPNNSTSSVDTTKLAFAELVVPKKSAYVGEVIPAILRLGFATRLVSLDGPHLAGQGFTMQKLEGGDQPQIEVINGRRFLVYTFKTAISPARPGKIDIGPVKATAKIIVPSTRRRSHSGSPFDMFNMDDFFNDPFFADPFGRMEKQDLPIESQPVSLEVKNVPPNAPANYNGAIGNFSMTVDVNPKTLQIGDPLTAVATISGRGNFDRVSAPVLENEQGWHKYPPSSKFKQDDEVGISGAKTFEIVLSPNERKSAISPFVFSYFDPVKEQYVTLTSAATPLQVTGGSAPASAPAPSAAAAPVASAPAPTPAKPATKPEDILYQLTDRPARVQTFTPIYARSAFWLIQLIPFAGLLCFIGWRIRRRHGQNRQAQRLAALNHESIELIRKLRRGRVSPQEYYASAARAVQVRTALAKNVEPGAVDVELAESTFNLDEASQERLRQLFARSDELRYSGAGNGGETLSPENRQEVLELIEHLK